ncbi:aldose epimerase family protein [Rossellomorea sp. BNER]|uniref:aldose epimerase family protein n=1 Tax=Rossellomorea sp. BNER TaxID=2962031 RepID=UPI003AF216C4|nr:galactose mutarotase [Rossellomorea sp. BNER]
MHIDTQTVQVHGQSPWTLYRLKNDHGMNVDFFNYGGIITKILVPDRNGSFENVVLGYENYEDYVENRGFLGALIGRVAGRIKNATFEIDGKMYQLDKNEGEHHLHGGKNGFHQALWEATPFQSDEKVGVKLTHHSKDGEEGYPGNVIVEVTYSLTNDNQFVIDYQANTDQITPLTLTNHSYFNLSGNAKRTIHDHQVSLDSSQLVELDHQLIPTGKWMCVSGTTYDFRKKRKLREGFTYKAQQHEVANGGYDHYFLFDKKAEHDIVLEDQEAGRSMTIQTDQPGVVMYTSNILPEGMSLSEGETRKYAGICLETQSSPASLHDKGFPNVLVTPDTPYHKQTVFTFRNGE